MKTKSLKIVLAVIAVLSLTFTALYTYAFTPVRGTRYLFPENYRGWICVTYKDKDFPLLKKEDGFYLIKVPEDGIVKTSSNFDSYDEEDRYIHTYDEHYYYSDKGIVKAEEIASGGGFTVQEDGEKAVTSYFWISTKGNAESDYEKYVKGRDPLSTPKCGEWEKEKN